MFLLRIYLIAILVTCCPTIKITARNPDAHINTFPYYNRWLGVFKQHPDKYVEKRVFKLDKNLTIFTGSHLSTANPGQFTTQPAATVPSSLTPTPHRLTSLGAF